MNLDELQSVQSRERQTDSLQQLRASFYRDAAEFVGDLREERERAAERAEDPFDAPEVNRLTDDIKTAEQTVEAIYDRRVGKIVKMASLAAADMPTEEDGLTAEERRLFESLVGSIEENRDHVLDVLAGDASPGAVTGGDTTADAGRADSNAGRADSDTGTADSGAPGVDAASAMGGGPAGGQSNAGGTDEERTGHGGDDHPIPPEEAMPETDGGARAAESGQRDAGAPSAGSPPTDDLTAGSVPGDATAGSDDAGGEATEGATGHPASDVERETVRITDDVGAIFGVDEREYDLSTDDVVRLPAKNAAPLVERDAAERLE
ncbi:MAG: hypothetical protein ABEJ89_07065 [Haloarculaceae archaeon]